MAARVLPVVREPVVSHALALAAPADEPLSVVNGASQWMIRQALRSSLAAYLGATRLARALGPATRPSPDGGLEILLTGTFYSDNWVRAHLYPLSLSGRCRRITVVSTYPVPAMDKVELIRPPAWLTRVAGS